MKILRFIVILTPFVFILFMLLLTTAVSISQVSEEWVGRYNGTGNGLDWAESQAVDADGNVYVTGYSWNGSDEDYATVKFNSSGVQQWVAIYDGGNGLDEAWSIAVDGSGNVYVTGFCTGSSTYYDYCTIKYNSSGAQQWVATYNGSGNGDDIPRGVVIDASGNSYVSGRSKGSNSDNDMVTIKYNSSGTQQWEARYDGPDHQSDGGFAIAIDGSSNIYVTGHTVSTSTNTDIVTIKYSSSGAQQWVTTYTSRNSYTDEAYAITLDGSGNVYIAGAKGGPSGDGYPDYLTIKYDNDGNQQWVATYNGNGSWNDYAFAITTENSDDASNVYVTGKSWDSGNAYDYVTIKYNSSGVQQWVSTYDGPGNANDGANAIVLDGSANVYVSGWSYGGTNNGYDYATIKYNSSGVQQWVIRYNGPTSDWDEADMGSIFIDNSSNVYVTGSSEGSGTNFDFATVKYSQSSPPCCNPLKVSFPGEYILEQNYPNPFNPKTNISFILPEASHVILKIFDISGRELLKLLDEFKGKGHYTVTFDGLNYASGIYFYKIITEKHIDMKKMVLLK